MMNKAFTLIEVIVVIVIIGLMSAIFIPVLTMIRGESMQKRTERTVNTESRAPEYILIDGKRYRLIQE